MKIGMICPFYPPHHGGTEKYVYNLSRIFKVSNHVTVITTQDKPGMPDFEINGNLKIIRFNYHIKPLNNPISIHQFKYVISNHKNFDILHFNDIYAFPTFSSLFIKKTPKVLTFHTWLIKYDNLFKNALSGSFEKIAFDRIIKKMDSLIVLVDSQKEYLEKMGIDHKKIHVIPNGIRNDFFGRDKETARKYFNIEPDFVFGFFGRLVERKGIRMLLDVFSRSDLDLFIFGNGPMKSQVLEYCRKYPNIHLIEGPFSEEEVALIYSALDLYILPSLSGEGCPTGILEALSSGTLCLASDLPENVCTLKDKGLFFRRADTGDLEEKIKYARSVHIDKNELKNFAAEYDWKKISEKIMDVYNGIT